MSVPESHSTDSKPKLRWYRIPSDRCAVLLLAVEGILLLSERFHWFGLDKGCTVLIAVAIVGTTFSFLFLCFIVSLIFRWRFQFSILSLFLLTLIVAILCSWLGNEIRSAARQQGALKEIGTVTYEGHGYRLDECSVPVNLLRGVLGDDFFATVPWLYLGGPQVENDALKPLQGLPQLKRLTLDDTRITDTGLEQLKGLTQLRELSLSHSSEVSDVGLEQLRGLTQLQELYLYNTRVTDKGVQKLQQALSSCKIHWGKINWELPTKDERQSPAAPNLLH